MKQHAESGDQQEDPDHEVPAQNESTRGQHQQRGQQQPTKQCIAPHDRNLRTVLGDLSVDVHERSHPASMSVD